MSDKPEKKLRPRRVFGRVRCIVDGKRFTLCMTKQGVELRPNHSRRVWKLPLKKLVLLTLAEAPLNRENQSS